MYNKKSIGSPGPKFLIIQAPGPGSFPAGFLAVAGGRLGNLWHTIHDALCHFLQSGEVHTWDVAMYYHAMREFWEGQNGSQAKYETKRRLEWNQGLQKSHQGRRMAATFCNGANFRDSKVVKQTPWGWIQMFNRDQRPIFGGERTERMEMLADDCATMQLLFASLRAGETREQPLHPRLVSLHLARKSYRATKRSILFKINRSRVAACKHFHQSITYPMCRCNEPQAAPVVKEVKKAWSETELREFFE